MSDNIIHFPRTPQMIDRDMNKIVDESIDIVERSIALLRWAEGELMNVTDTTRRTTRYSANNDDYNDNA